MMYHRVEPGDYVLKIAMRNGFTNERALWDHPQNAALKQKRISPNTLAPGDRLFIPDKQQNQVSRATGQMHSFQIKNPEVKLRITLRSEDHQPVRQADCRWSQAEKRAWLSLGRDGLLEQEIPLSLSNGELIVRSEEPRQEDAPLFQAQIGYLYPASEVQGQLDRLRNMGYYLGSGEEVDPYQLRSALEEFQCDNDLPLTGSCDANTRQRLVEIYGC